MSQEWADVADPVFHTHSLARSHAWSVAWLRVLVHTHFVSRSSVSVCVPVRGRCLKSCVAVKTQRRPSVSSLLRPFWSRDIVSLHSKSWWAAARLGGGNDLRKKQIKATFFFLQFMKSLHNMPKNTWTVIEGQKPFKFLIRATTIDYWLFYK